MAILARTGVLPESIRKCVKEYLAKVHGNQCEEVETNIRELRGGLDSSCVLHVRTIFRTRDRRVRSGSFVLKRSQPGGAEGRVHVDVLPSSGLELAPTLLGFHQAEGEHVYMFEYVRRSERWPWSASNNSRLVLDALAGLHGRRLTDFAADRSYELILVKGASRLQEHLEGIPRGSELGFARGSIPVVRRMAEALPRIRRRLLDNGLFGSTLIHGDVHSGNVLLRKRRNGVSPVFLIGAGAGMVRRWKTSVRGCNRWDFGNRRRSASTIRYCGIIFRCAERKRG